MKYGQKNIVSERGAGVEGRCEKWNVNLRSVFLWRKQLKYKSDYIKLWVLISFRVLYKICGMEASIFEVKAV